MRTTLPFNKPTYTSPTTMTTPDRSKAPEIYQIGRLNMPEVEHLTLSNGIKLTTYSGGDEKVNRLTVTMAGGAAEEPSAGFSGLMAATTIEGTASLNAAKIADILDYNGSWFSSGTSVHDTTRTFFSLNSRFDKVAATISEMISSPSFPIHETAVAIEKAACKAEIENEKVAFHASKALDSMLMGTRCPLARRPDAATIRNITPEQLHDYYFSHLSTTTIRIYLSGRIDAPIINTIESTFGSINLDGNSKILSDDPTFTPVKPGSTVRIDRRGALQSAIAAGVPTIGRNHPDYEKLRLAIVFLGGYFGSRLMLNIREDKGYTYGIGASLTGYRNNGFIKIATECDNLYVDAVINEIAIEMKRMHDPSTYSKTELDRCRSFMATTLCSQLDSPFAVMDYHQNIDLIGTPYDYFNRQQDSLKNMTPESLAETAVKYLDPDKLCIAIAGQTEEKSSPVK